MENCHDIDGLLTAYVDGEACAADRAFVDGHLAACPPCRQRAAVEGAARTVLRARIGLLPCDAPEALRARCLALASARQRGMRVSSLLRWRMVPLVMAAALVVAVGGILAYGLASRSPAALATQLALDHVKCFALFPGAGPVDVRAAEAGLQERYGWQIRLPEGGGRSGLQLIGARRCLYAEGLIAHLMYRVQGRPVSLFVLPGTVRPSAMVRALGHEAVIWSSAGKTFVLLGREPRADLERMAADLSGQLE
jgi:anti-sigma factor RsiW